MSEESFPVVDRSHPIPPVDQMARLDALAVAVRRRTDLVPRFGLVLGSGLGGLASGLTDSVVIPFSDLPGWPLATAPGHAGRLLLGRLEGVPVAVLQGRFHLYEGNDAGLVVQPVLLFRRLGAEGVILTNAAGGLNPAWGPGTLMLIADHINLTGRSPLIGPNADALGPRFPDLTDAWSPRLRERLRLAAGAEGVALEEGVYLQVLGPSYETPAEIRMAERMGADAVGMSTAVEVIAARARGVRCLAFSTITNHAAGITGERLSHAEVIEVAARVAGSLERLVEGVVRALSG